MPARTLVSAAWEEAKEGREREEGGLKMEGQKGRGLQSIDSMQAKAQGWKDQASNAASVS
jgi:hypothetical protein